jgi:hypothetical protein
VVKDTLPLFHPWGRNLVPILQKAGWAAGPVWTGAENHTGYYRHVYRCTDYSCHYLYPSPSIKRRAKTAGRCNMHRVNLASHHRHTCRQGSCNSATHKAVEKSTASVGRSTLRFPGGGVASNELCPCASE